MKQRQEISKKILWSGIEDYTGLWEIYWELNSAYAYLSETEKRQILCELLISFVDRNWVTLFWCKEPYGELKIIENSVVKDILSNPLVFNEPGSGNFAIRFKTSQLGEETLKMNQF